MEIWKDVIGYEGYYQISNFGNVKSIKNNTKEYRLKKCFDKNKYLILVLYKNNIKKTFKVHRLVAKAFILNPENKPQVNHINGIKTDNRVENLEWVTPKENVNHCYLKGLKKGFRLSQKGSSNPNSKITEKDVLEIRKSNSSVKETCIKYNISQSSVYRIIKNKSWT